MCPSEGSQRLIINRQPLTISLGVSVVVYSWQQRQVTDLILPTSTAKPYRAINCSYTLASMATDTNNFVRTLESISKSSFRDDEDRARAASAAWSLFIRLETAYERFHRQGWQMVSGRMIEDVVD